jgi:hypothetical protein
MKTSGLISSIVIGGACFGFSDHVKAATTQTLGAGSAVTSIDRSATFDSITRGGIPLSDYIEGKLFIGANADSFVGFDPFAGATGSDPYFYCLDGGSMGGGADSWVLIQTTDSAKMFGVEFVYGNSWSNGGSSWGNENAWVEWQTLNGATVVSAGQIGPDPILHLGTIVGFYDPAGFDQLRVKCNVANQADPNIQALALDNLHVQLTNLPPAPVISGSDIRVDPATGVPAFTLSGTRAGFQYRMLYTETLTPPAWNPLTPPLPDGWTPGGGTLTLKDPGAAGKPHRFYRVEAR